jgi:hypothetical protein
MNIATMGHVLYYCGAGFAVSMAMCCSITMIVYPLFSYGSVIMSSILQTVPMLYCCELFINITPAGSLLCLTWSPLSHMIMLFNNHSSLPQLSDSDICRSQHEVKRNRVINEWKTLTCLLLGGGGGSTRGTCYQKLAFLWYAASDILYYNRIPAFLYRTVQNSTVGFSYAA